MVSVFTEQTHLFCSRTFGIPHLQPQLPPSLVGLASALTVLVHFLTPTLSRSWPEAITTRLPPRGMSSESKKISWESQGGGTHQPCLALFFLLAGTCTLELPTIPPPARLKENNRNREGGRGSRRKPENRALQRVTTL